MSGSGGVPHTPDRPARWRKKPVEIEAMRLDMLGAQGSGQGANYREVCEWINGVPLDEGRWDNLTAVPDGDTLLIVTLEGEMTAQHGDWIIRGVQGEFYPCKPDIFAATYEAAGSSSDQPADGEREDESGRRLWGRPGSEVLYFDVDEAYDCQLDGEASGTYVLEEWTIQPPAQSIPTASWIVEWVAESACDEFSDDGDTYERLCGDSDLLTAAEALAQKMASKITWRQADKKVADHEVVVVVHDDGSATATLDGQPFRDHPARGGV